MGSKSKHPSLYEDWQSRRAALDWEPADSATKALERILDFLLNRYAERSEAAQPARFPLAQNLNVNERAIIVNHHLGARLVAGVKTEQEATQRVSSILKRMSGEVTKAETDPFEDPFFESLSVPPPKGVAQLCRDALETDRRLAARLIRSSSIPRIFNIWRKQVVAHGSDPVSVLAEYRMREHADREAVANALRRELAGSFQVRLRAAALLGEFGDLHDIGLLSDLVHVKDTPPGERRVLLTSLRKLADLDAGE